MSIASVISLKRSVLVGLCIGVTFVPLLAGCTVNNIDREPVSFRVNDAGKMEVALCLNAEIEKFKILQRVNGDWQDLWVAEGAAPVTKGDIWVFGQEVPGLSVEVLAEPTLGSESQLAVSMNTTDGGGVLSMFPKYSRDELESGKWFYTDGAVLSKPCVMKNPDSQTSSEPR